MSAVGDMLQLLALSLLSCVRLSLVLRLFLPGLYMNLLLLLVPKLLGSCKWLWMLVPKLLGSCKWLWMLLSLLLLSVLSPLLCTGLSLMMLLGLLRLSQGACTCGSIIRSASSLPMLETLASCAQRLFSFALVSSDG